MPPLPLIRRDAFRTDLIDLYAHIAQEQPQAADRFALKVNDLLGQIHRLPEAGRVWRPNHPGLTEVRFRVVSGFKALLFYRIDTDHVLMLRALHGARGDLETLLGSDGQDAPVD